MRVLAKTRWLPKRGNAAEEYEDAFYPKEPPKDPSQSYRFAVSDGASESMLSGQWAEVLVKSFCRGEGPVSRASARAAVGRACVAYEAWVQEYLRRREREGRPVQWYEEPGLQAGAFATILGLSLLSEGRWEAVALGDSCLFQMRGNCLIARFPIRRSSEFGQRPLLLASNPAKNLLAMGKLRIASGAWRRGDKFYLMTDAVAAWFLKEFEQSKEPWAALGRAESGLTDAGGSGEHMSSAGLPFEDLVESMRSQGLMRNDDVTVTSIRVV